MSIPTVNDLAASARSTRWVLTSRPSGWPTSDVVRLETVELPELSDGEIRVVNEAISASMRATQVLVLTGLGDSHLRM